LFSEELGHALVLINIYGPYAERKRYWDSLALCPWLSQPGVIVGGDLNFSLGATEVWGPRSILDPLTDYFSHYFDTLGLLDLYPVKLQPTWQNLRTGDARIAKRLDRFLLTEEMVDSLGLAHQWVASGGESDHNPIILELSGRVRRTPNPFKFFEGWLKDPDYQALVRTLWIPIGPIHNSHVAILFMENLKKVKQATISWAHEKKVKEE
jgi:hypothetical protein